MNRNVDDPQGSDQFFEEVSTTASPGFFDQLDASNERHSQSLDRPCLSDDQVQALAQDQLQDPEQPL